jgi:hypothetical protein
MAGKDSRTAIGSGALPENTTGSYTIVLGPAAGLGVLTASNVVCISLNGQNVDNSCYIGNIFGADATRGEAVFITSVGKPGTVKPSSAARFKDEIKPMDKASEDILAFKPVTFHNKKEFDSNRTPQFELMAEE